MSMQLLLTNDEVYSLEILNSRMHEDWGTIMYPIFNTPSVIKLFEKVQIMRKTHAVLPQKSDMLKVLKYPPSHYKVVVLGESPYYTYYNGKPVADGLAFSATYETPTLRKINEKMEMEIGKRLDSNNLEYLADQGVLLLNTMLSVSNIQNNKVLHNKDLLRTTDWSLIIQTILNSINADIALLWGKYALKYQRYFKNCIVSEHPVAASYGKRVWDNNDCFLKTKHIIQW